MSLRKNREEFQYSCSRRRLPLTDIKTIFICVNVTTRVWPSTNLLHNSCLRISQGDVKNKDQRCCKSYLFSTYIPTLICDYQNGRFLEIFLQEKTSFSRWHSDFEKKKILKQFGTIPTTYNGLILSVSRCSKRTHPRAHILWIISAVSRFGLAELDIRLVINFDRTLNYVNGEFSTWTRVRVRARTLNFHR